MKEAFPKLQLWESLFEIRSFCTDENRKNCKSLSQNRER
jgi:hypothetical protein